MLKNLKSNNLIVRAAAYIEGEDHLKAGHALRQARSDRRNQGYRQPRHQINGIAPGQDDAQVLNGLDPNTAVTTNGTSNKPSSSKQENVKIDTEEQGKQLDPSTQKPKKKGTWQHRHQKPRKGNNAATANHNTAEVTVVNGSTESKTTVVSPNHIKPLE